MRLNIVKTLFLKEIKEIVRDKNQLFLLILMPFFMYPFMIIGMSQISSVQSNKLKQKEVNIWVEKTVSETPLYECLQSEKQYQIQIASVGIDTLKEAIAISVDADYQNVISEKGTANFQLYYDSNSDAVKMAANKIEDKIASLNTELVAERLEMAQLNSEFMEPLAVEKIDISSTGSMGSYWLKVIPSFIIFLIFIGTIYTAIDTTAGEKERKTLQNIYVAPLKMGEIIAGKFAAVFSVGLLSGLANVMSLLLSFFWISTQSEGNLGNMLPTTVTLSGWLWIVLLILLATAIISSINLAVLLQAKTYKEAQGYITPLMLLLLIPLGLVSIMELDGFTVFLPILNILLALSAILKGTAELSLLFLVFAISLIYAGLALYVSALAFGNERVITGQRINYRQLWQQKGKGSKRVFGATEALVFIAIVMLAFLLIGTTLQVKLPIWAGILSSFSLILGGLSVAAIYYYDLHKNLKENLHLNRPTWRATLATLLLVPATYVVAMFLYSIFGTEDHSDEFMKALQPLVEMNTVLGLFFLAGCPAIFEELVCRGVLFRGLKNEWRKWPVIIASGLLFSLLHFDVYRFIPIVLVGIMLGYILWQSNSIYLTALFHFCYNAIAYFLVKYWGESMQFADFHSIPISWLIAGLVLMGIGVGLLAMEKDGTHFSKPLKILT